jgi:hypothetical protein
VQKLQAVFSEAAFQLAENPAYNGNAGLIAFAQLLQQDAPMIAGMMAAFAAIQFLPPPWNVGIDSLLIATGMTMVGVDGVQLIAYLLRMASEIDDTDICDGERLQGLGEELAEELFNRGLEVAEGALLGGLGAMGSLSRAFRNLNNRPLNGESHEEMTDEVVRRMRQEVRTPNAEAIELLSDPAFIERVNDVVHTDCDDIARMLYQATGGQGSILDFTTPSGVIRVRELGQLEDFVDHRVYSDGYYIFDPRYSSDPVPVQEYIEDLRRLNPDLITRDVTP